MRSFFTFLLVGLVYGQSNMSQPSFLTSPSLIAPFPASSTFDPAALTAQIAELKDIVLRVEKASSNVPTLVQDFLLQHFTALPADIVTLIQNASTQAAPIAAEVEDEVSWVWKWCCSRRKPQTSAVPPSAPSSKPLPPTTLPSASAPASQVLSA